MRLTAWALLLLSLALLAACTPTFSVFPANKPSALAALPAKIDLPLPAPTDAVALERERILKADANMCRREYDKAKGEPQ